MANDSYVITPDSDIYLLKCPLEIDSLNQLDFATATAQNNYFMSLTKVLMDDATYMRKDGRLYFEGSYDTYVGYNYCMYKNTNYSNKWFYAFISDMRYESNNSISCDLTTDVFQTWMFEKQVKNSFVERSHVSVASDTAGAYTYPEGLETGEYICNGIETVDLGLRWYVLGCTKQYDYSFHAGGGIYNGIYSGKTYYAVRTASDVEDLISTYDTAGYGEDITELFIVPAKLIGNPTYDVSNPVVRITQSVSPETLASKTISRPTNINGYTPKNKKLLAYPYQYLLVDNNGGNSITYQYELFTTPSSCIFLVVGALTPGTSMSILPNNYTYNGGNTYTTTGGTAISDANMFNYSLTLAKYPICNWNTDVYTNWLTQNSVNMQYNVISNTSQGAIQGAKIGGTVGPVGGVVGGVIGGTLGNLGGVYENDMQKHEHQFAPNQSKGNANAGDIITSCNSNKPYFYKMSIREEYAHIIDDYFTMFGYKINRLQAVNTTSRSNWNFIKTIDVNIEGDIPQGDMQKLKSLYNNGFTIWHIPNKFLDYSQTNS